MGQADWSRRAMLAALAAAAAGPATSQGAAPAWRAGALAANTVARGFVPAPGGLRLPDVTLAGAKGARRLAELRGRTLLIPLWAEWCAPCIAELPDFAALQARHGNARFAIAPILTASKKKLNPAAAAQILAKVKAGRFEALAEPNGGDVLYKSLTRGGRLSANPTLPCNLLVDPTGRVVARQFGGMMLSATGLKDLPPALRPKPGQTSRTVVLTEAQRREMMAKAQAGASRTIWATPAADAFVAALAGGLLDRS